MVAGFRSPLYPLGLSAPPHQRGYRSLLAFWMGGACAGESTPPIPPTPTPGGGFKLVFRPSDVRHLREDEEILAIITAFLNITNR